MRTFPKLALTALAAALLLCAAVGTTSARNLSASSFTIRATWSRIEFVASGITASCQVTLEGSFHERTIAKTLGTLVGVVTRASIKTESCTNARATIARLPWHATYEGFTGTLPNIATIRLLVTEYLFTIERPAGFTPNCSYGTATDRDTLSAALSSGVVTNLRPDAGNVTHLLEARNEELFGRCPPEGELRGGATDGQATVLNTANRITVTLI